ncbi:MAG: hypothetical protein PF442_11355 [Desulfobulbaceae bacterium]|jgi:hypothetical protein|nr:hypothetical protein [Desulfobulbaceae bacterium]
MIMKRFGMAALLLSAIALTTTGCGMINKGSGEKGTKMSGAEHKRLYPEGHNRSLGKNCYYDQKTDSFFCTYTEE